MSTEYKAKQQNQSNQHKPNNKPNNKTNNKTNNQKNNQPNNKQNNQPNNKTNNQKKIDIDTNISKIVYSVETDKDTIFKAGIDAKITEIDYPKYNKSTMTMEYSDGGIYSERIFGLSRYSDRIKMSVEKSDKTVEDRMIKFGYIETVPYILPELYVQSNNVINKIIMSTSTLITNIIRGDGMLVLIGKQSAFLNDQENINKMESAEKHSKGRFLDTSASIRKNSKYKYWYVPTNIMRAIKPETLKQDSIDTVLCAATFNNEPDCAVTTGTIAIAHLLAQSNMVDDYMEMEEIKQYMLTNDPIKYKDPIRSITSNISVIKGLMEQGLQKRELIRQLVTVVPAGLREFTIQNSNKPGGKDIESISKISEAYNNCLKETNIFSSKYDINVDIDEIFKDKDNITFIKSLKTHEQSYITSYSKIVKSIEDVTNSINDQLKGKQGRLRKTVLSKRIDESGGAVLIPAPELDFDTIGVPIKIILSNIKEELKESNVYKSLLVQVRKELEINTRVNDLLLIERFLLSKDNTIPDISVKKQLSGNKVKYHSLNKLNIKFKQSSKLELKEKILKLINDIIKDFRVIFIRYPSLHRFNEQTFKIVISLSNNIKIHPMYCEGYNADFDGDRGSVKFLKNSLACGEADYMMMPSRNLVNAQGKSLRTPKQDAVLGAYWLTEDWTESDKEGKKLISSPEKPIKYTSYEAMKNDFDLGLIQNNDIVEVMWRHYEDSIYMEDYLRTKRLKSEKTYYKSNVIETLTKELDTSLYDDNQSNIQQLPDFKLEHPLKLITSTVGKFIFNSYVPQDLGNVNREQDPYSLEYDTQINSKLLSTLMSKIIDKKRNVEVSYAIDTIKKNSFHYATLSGISISVLDITQVEKDKDILEGVNNERKINEEFKAGLITEEERKDKVIASWTKITDRVSDRAIKNLDEKNPIKQMMVSGSRANKSQVTQMIAMRGIMKDENSDAVETPVTSSIGEGMSNEQFNVAAKGARSGIYDRTNRTKVTGDTMRTDGFGLESLTITVGDCSDTEGVVMKKLNGNPDIGSKDIPLSQRVIGRFTLEDIKDENGNIVVKAGDPIAKEYAEIIDKNYTELKVRSILSCKAHQGVCVKCHGKAFINNAYPKIGMAVGTIAAQTPNESGSQLTMRTFHTGGVAKNDISGTVDRVKKMKETAAFTPEILNLSTQALQLFTYSKKTEEIKDNARKRVIDFYNKYKIRTLPDYARLKEEIDITLEDLGIVDAYLVIKLRELIRDSLMTEYNNGGVDMKDCYFEPYGREMTNHFKVLDEGDSSFMINQTITFTELIETNIGLVANKLQPVLVIHDLKNMKELATSSEKATTMLMYQDIAKNISKVASMGLTDPMVNPKATLVASNTLSTGEQGAAAVHSKINETERNIETKEEWINKISEQYNWTKPQPQPQPQQSATQQPAPQPAPPQPQPEPEHEIITTTWDNPNNEQDKEQNEDMVIPIESNNQQLIVEENDLPTNNIINEESIEETEETQKNTTEDKETDVNISKATW